MMDQATLELAKKMYDLFKAPVAKAMGEGALTRYQDALVDAFPILRHLTSIRIRRLERSLEHLHKRLGAIEATADPTRLNAFADIAFRYFEAGAKEHRDVKLRILAAACAHCADSCNADPFDKMLDFFEAVEHLQPFHFRILDYLDAKHFRKPKGKDGHTHLRSAQLEAVAESLGAADDDGRLWLIRALVQLHEMGLVQLERDSFVTMYPGSGDAGTVTSPYVVFLVSPFGLTTFGCQLLRYARQGFTVEEGFRLEDG